MREALLEAIPTTPSALRPSVAAAAEPGPLEGRLASALDRAIGAHPDLRPPTSVVWTLLGIGQTANLVLLVFAVAWTILWVLARPAVDTVELPLIGQLPMPFALLAGALALGFVLARLLSLHAGWVGRRWAGRLAAAIRAGTEEAVAGEAFAVLDRVEAARRALWVAARQADGAAG